MPTGRCDRSQQDDRTVVIVIDKSGTLKINQEDTDWTKLEERLIDIFKTRAEKVVFVKGDPEVKYQDVIFAMDAARGGGVKVIGMTPKDNGGGGAAAPAKKRK